MLAHWPCIFPYCIFSIFLSHNFHITVIYTPFPFLPFAWLSCLASVVLLFFFSFSSVSSPPIIWHLFPLYHAFLSTFLLFFFPLRASSLSFCLFLFLFSVCINTQYSFRFLLFHEFLCLICSAYLTIYATFSLVLVASWTSYAFFLIISRASLPFITFPFFLTSTLYIIVFYIIVFSSPSAPFFPSLSPHLSVCVGRAYTPLYSGYTSSSYNHSR